MLIYHQPNQTIYIIGDGIVACQIQSLIAKEHAFTQLVSPDNVDTVPDGSQCFMGFMNHNYRSLMLSRTEKKQFAWPSFIHSTAFIADGTQIGSGTIILDHAHLGYGSVVGNWCFLDSKVTLAHGSKLGTNCVFALGSTVGGSTVIGDNVVAGINCTFCNKITVCNQAKFAMCSVVSHDILEPASYYGTKKIKQVIL